MRRILFVCTGNVFRSPSAEYILKKYFKDNNMESKFQVFSAGIIANPEELNSTVIRELKKLGIDVSKHKQRKLNSELIEGSDLIVSMDKKHKEFIKKNFGIESPLFNFICYGKEESVLDIDDVLDDPVNDIRGRDKHFKKTILYIYKSMPIFVKNARKFINYR